MLRRRSPGRPAKRATPSSRYGRGLRPRPRERKAAHRADSHFAGHVVAGNLAGEFQRQRHRVGDGDFPGDVVALGGAVEDLGRIALGGLRAGQRAARILQAQGRVALAHRRAHGDAPVSVHGHLKLSSIFVRKTGMAPGFGLSSGGGIAHPAADAQSREYGLLARAARIRLMTRTRNATYWMAKAATLAPIRTTDT